MEKASVMERSFLADEHQIERIFTGFQLQSFTNGLFIHRHDKSAADSHGFRCQVNILGHCSRCGIDIFFFDIASGNENQHDR